VVARPLDWVSVKGKSKVILVYELLGRKNEVSRQTQEFVDRYTRALNYYRKQDWSRAIGLFEEVLNWRVTDHAAQQMIMRCRHYQAESPGDDWDGVHRVISK
jgi:adenylate cyclase